MTLGWKNGDHFVLEVDYSNSSSLDNEPSCSCSTTNDYVCLSVIVLLPKKPVRKLVCWGRRRRKSETLKDTLEKDLILHRFGEHQAKIFKKKSPHTERPKKQPIVSQRRKQAVDFISCSDDSGEKMVIALNDFKESGNLLEQYET